LDFPTNIKLRLWVTASSIVSVVLGLVAGVTIYISHSSNQWMGLGVALLLGTFGTMLSIVGFFVFKGRSDVDEELHEIRNELKARSE
jgi:hypothetical protein